MIDLLTGHFLKQCLLKQGALGMSLEGEVDMSIAGYPQNGTTRLERSAERRPGVLLPPTL